MYLFENCIDFDLSSLYPSIILAFNISPETCYGKIIIMNKDGIDIAKEFMDDYTSKDYVNFCHVWFGTPLVSDLIRKMEEQEAVVA